MKNILIAIMTIIVLAVIALVILSHQKPSEQPFTKEVGIESGQEKVRIPKGSKRLETEARSDGIAQHIEESDTTELGTIVADGTIAGLVKTSDGRPVSDAAVILLIYIRPKDKYEEPDQNASRTTITGTDGTFEITGVAAKRLYGLRVTADGYVETTAKDIIVDGNDVIITLQYGTSISGRVIREDTNEPIEGADVRFAIMVSPSWGRDNLPFLNGSTKSDSQGYYSFYNLPAWKEYRIEAASRDSRKEVSVGEDQSKDGVWDLISDPITVFFEEGEHKKKVNFYMYPTLSISGQIVLWDTGEPVPGIRIWLERKGSWNLSYGCGGDTISGSDGKFSFAGLGEGDYELKMHKINKYYMDLNDSGNEIPVAFTLWKSEKLGPIIVKVGYGNLLYGCITDENGEAIKGIFVRPFKFSRERPYPLNVHANSLVDGSYRIEYLPPDVSKFLICFESRNYLKEEEIVEFEEGETEKEFNIVLSSGFTISGKVIDPTSNPIEGVTVWASGEGQIQKRVMTDSDGYYTMTGITEGQWELTARKTGNVRKVEDTVFVTTEDVHNVDLVLDLDDNVKTRWISGKVIIDRDQLPDELMMGCLLEAPGKPPINRRIGIDDKSTFTLKNIPEGVYDLTFIYYCGSSYFPDMRTRKTFHNVPTGTDDLVVRFTTAGWISGRVIDSASREPVGNCMITTSIWNGEEDRYDYMHVDYLQSSDGKFKIDVPCTGIFKVEVVSCGGYTENTIRDTMTTDTIKVKAVSYGGYAKNTITDIMMTEKGFPEELVIELEKRKFQIIGTVYVEPESPAQLIFLRDAEIKLRKRGSKNGFTLSRTITNEAGIFLVEPPGPGQYDLQIEHPDYDTKIIEPINVDGKQPVSAGNILLSRKGSEK